MNLQMSKCTIVLQWSEEDQCYVVLLPEFENVMQPVTRGETREEESAIEDKFGVRHPVGAGRYEALISKPLPGGALAQDRGHDD